jgi:hypothetical protein
MEFAATQAKRLLFTLFLDSGISYAGESHPNTSKLVYKPNSPPYRLPTTGVMSRACAWFSGDIGPKAT